MYEPTINYLAFLVSAVIFFIIGGLWYSPLMFANPWIKAMGFSDEKLKEIKANRGHFINTGNQLVGLLIMGAILGIWV